MEEDLSINKKLDKIIEGLQAIPAKEEVIEEKPFKIPFGARVSKGKAKKGWTTVQIIRNNGNIDFKRVQVTDGTVRVDDFPRVATIDYKLTYKGRPFLIVPEWSMKPFSAVENYEETVKEKMNMAGRKIVLSKLEGEQLKKKTGFGGIGWIILLIVGAGVGWYIMQGGTLF
jgi:hypothetical protein